MNCPTCGQAVPVGNRFCANCGAEVVGEEDHPPAPNGGTIVDTEPIPYLLIAAGPDRGQVFDLRGEVRLGRGRSNAISLSDGKVSRNHLRLDPVRDTYILTDLGSANGTFVNGVRTTQPVRLRDGDSITVGDTHLVFHTGPPSQATGQPLLANGAPAFPPPPPVAAAGPSLTPGSTTSMPTGVSKVPTWVWLGCAAVVIAILLLIIIALTTGILIGQGLGGI
jgi:hypothetical protein